LSPRETAAALPGQPRDETGPVFAEPWQAQAFALAVQLSEAGYFTWAEWAETLGTELRAAGEDDGSRYYDTWLRAQERLSLSKGLTDPSRLISALPPGPTPIAGPRTVNRWNSAARRLGFGQDEGRLTTRQRRYWACRNSDAAKLGPEARSVGGALAGVGVDDHAEASRSSAEKPRGWH
jgi:nitrile hydratase accessory protein